MVGQTLAHFRIDAKLGEGGMGVVYRATDMKLGREVALKVLPAQVAGDDERRWRFLREARSAAAVTHPNIATVYEIGDANGDVFIAMELVAGVTLREKMVPGLTHAEAWRVAKEISRGLARAHDKGVVHRDLKPENVMVTPDGEVKILDFGLAKLRDQGESSVLSPSSMGNQRTMDGRVMGTPAYMSPEQAEGRPDIDARSDVFSFGSMLYEMLAGVPPFEGASSITILYSVINHEAKPLTSVVANVPETLATVVARCMMKAPAERFGGGRELFAALGGETSHTSIQPATGRAAPAERQATGASGMALGATVASDSASMGTASGAVVVRQSGSGSMPSGSTVVVPKTRSWLLIGAFVGLVVVVGGGVGVSLKLRRATVAVNDSQLVMDGGRDAGPTKPVAMTDHPPPKVGNPEALTPYLTALVKLRVGGAQAMHDLRKAVQLDTTFAAAHLRIALYGAYMSEAAASERQASVAKANLFKGSLDDRDQALLAAAAVIAPAQVDYEAASTVMRQISSHFPGDAEIALLEYLYMSKRRRPPNAELAAAQARELEAAAQKVRDLDPGATQLLRARAASAMPNGIYTPGQKDDPAPIIAECLKTAPEATGCRSLEARLFLESGKCADVLVDARTLVDKEPEEPDPFYLLSTGIASTLGAVEGVKSALHQENDFVATTPETPKGLQDLFYDLFVGDFTNAETALTDEARVAAIGHQESRHAPLFGLRIALSEETGGKPKPLGLTTTFTNLAAAWSLDAPLEIRMKRLYLLRTAGKHFDAAAFTAAREALLAEEFTRTARPGASEDATSKDEDLARLRLQSDARYVETAADAKAALTNVSKETLAYVRHKFPLDTGRLLLLAGRVDEALPLLKYESERCDAVGHLKLDAPSLEATVNYMHAHLLYGQASESKKDKKTACEAYGVIEAMWKNATPRSVTLETAKERSRALACPAPR